MEDGMAALESKNEIVVYQPNETLRLDVRLNLNSATPWFLTQRHRDTEKNGLKDAGAALFAMMRMELDPAVILGLLPG